MPAKKATKTETQAVETNTTKSISELRAEYAKYVLEFRMRKATDSSKLKRMRREIARALTNQNAKK